MGAASKITIADEAAAAAAAGDSKPPIDGNLPGFGSIARLLLRILTLVLSVLTLAFLVSSQEKKRKDRVALLDIHAKWSDSKALVFLAVTTAISLGYSLLYTTVFFVVLRVKGNSFTKNKALKWIVFLADQLLAYAMLSAAAAATEVAYLGKNGQMKSGWFAVCGVVKTFCNKIGLALVLSFFTMIPLAINAFISAYHLKTS